MRRVYVDTSVLLPLLNAADDDHDAVREAVAALLEDPELSLVTSSYVLVEAGALVKRRFGGEVFRRLGEVAAATLEVVFVDDDLHHRAWARAAEEGRRGPSLVDWVGRLLVTEGGIATVLALDKHFNLPGVALLP